MLSDMLQHWQFLLAELPNKLLALGSWLILALLILTPLERLFPARPQALLRRDFWSDVALCFISGVLPAFVMVLTMGAVAATGHVLLPQAWFATMAELPEGLRLLLMIVAGELGYYWGHRWAHELPDIWQFHALHHSATEMDWLVNARAHPLDLVFVRTVSFVPVFFLGLAQSSEGRADPMLAAAVAFSTAWSFFIHANLKWRLGWLEHIVSTPAFHHWHHTADGPAVVNKNYASLFPWLDRLFGSYHLPRDQWPQSYGIDQALKPGLWRQLGLPLAKPTERSAAAPPSPLDRTA